jgi:anti-repressor protein
LYDFLGMTERFSNWCARMFSYGLEENVDFTTVGFHTVVNQGGTKEIGDYLLTIEAAKHIAMVQRCEKGKQARQYFINVEKMYLKTLSNKQTSDTIVEKIRNVIVEQDGEMVPRKDYNIICWQKKWLR